MGQHHLSDDRLIEVCLEGAPPAEAQHLADCPACEGRRATLADLLTDTRDVVAAGADTHFTPDRLAKQRARILERLEHEARHGRVITFPAAQSYARALPRRPRTRWIAAAAAAGLLIGFVAEHAVHRIPDLPPTPATIAGVDSGADTLQFATAPLSEEEVLGRIEMAVEGTTGSALRPLDDLTPRVWEIAAQ
ncbi:MAG: hypothetical protein HYU37_19830 [Acidobacteria bacterium]|nr:hypothetical protein [Acidobacteriota bacterium]